MQRRLGLCDLLLDRNDGQKRVLRQGRIELHVAVLLSVKREKKEYRSWAPNRIARMSWLLAAALVLTPAEEADVAKALRNLAQMHEIAAALLVVDVSHRGAPADLPPDPWGTPYRLQGGRIISAGSDGKFEEGELANEQFAGTEGDVVFGEDGVFRSNRNWLAGRAKSGDAATALNELRQAEMEYMMLRTPTMRDLMAARITREVLERGGERDAWGTPIRIEGARRISAGMDRAFDPMSWDRPPQPDLDEDIVADDGKVTRAVDPGAYIRKHPPKLEPVAQPVDGRVTSVTLHPGDDVSAPVTLTRLEPRYPDDYRRARIEGLVMVDFVVGEEGRTKDVRVIKSLAPELDMAAVEAIRQWTYTPAMRDGKPVAVVMTLAVSFKLQ